MAPEFHIEQLAMKDDEDPQRFPMFLRWAALTQPKGFNPSLEVVTEDLVRQMHARGTKVNVWTVDEEADMRRLAGWGVDGIISNKPDVVLNVLRSMKKHP
jgi:glycerophosphoryl diester phosphodiesterase